MYFPLHRTRTVVSNWIPPLFAKLGFIILDLPNYHTDLFCVLVSHCVASPSAVLPLNDIFPNQTDITLSPHADELMLLFRTY